MGRITGIKLIELSASLQCARHSYCGGVAWPPLQEHLILGAIVLPRPISLLYLAVFDIILSNQAFYRRKSRTFAGVDGRIDRQEEQDLRIYGLKTG
jgi:hypothetical protein